jgi:apolipoprotein N-acyltransferase
MRSLELDRPSLRATNTGVTALIDRYGRVQAELPRASQGVLRVQVRGNEGQTVFVRWAGKYGQLPLWAVAFALIALVFLQRQRH